MVNAMSDVVLPEDVGLEGGCSRVDTFGSRG